MEQSSHRSLTDNEFAHLCDDKSLLFVVCMQIRPGSCLFAVDLEYHHYPPDTPENDLFNIGLSRWEEFGWMIVSVPINDRDVVDRVAERNGLRLADGVPQMLGCGGIQTFPLNGDNVFTLENTGGSGEVNWNDPESRKEEFEKVDKIIKLFEKGATNV